jgi:hypothetical protein
VRGRLGSWRNGSGANLLSEGRCPLDAGAAAWDHRLLDRAEVHMANGSFSAEPETIWLTEPGDRRMQLLREFTYTDPDGRTWTAPNEMKTDGASIPPALWSFVGSPFTGPYRRAAIVHDAACDDDGGDDVKRATADKMFYFACLCGGCSDKQAELLYAGVRVGAWTNRIDLWQVAPQEALLPSAGAAAESLPARSMRTTYEEIAHELQSREPLQFDELQAIVDKHLQAKAVQVKPAGKAGGGPA